jgi:hypothetical protein
MALKSVVWKDQVKDFSPVLMDGGLVNFTKIDDEYLLKLSPEKKKTFEEFKGEYTVNFTEAGRKCHFLTFLYDTSNFYHKTKVDDLTLSMTFETQKHLLSKLCAIGYLLHNYIDDSRSYAVIANDGKIGNVNGSHGRSGKSLVGCAVGHMLPQKVIPGKAKDLTMDKFLWHGVNEKTKNVFFDDVQKKFDFEFLFPVITGPLEVNEKSGRRFVIPKDKKPKIIITTNFTIEGDSDSFEDRQFNIIFSDYYTPHNKPEHKFGMLFWSDWDFEQWNLFYNLMAECVQLWLKYGKVEPPSDRLTSRKLRQVMGEEFLSWAELYYDEDTGNNLNCEIPRETVYDNFLTSLKNQKMQQMYNTSQVFKKKLKAFCTYMGYQFNPHSTTKGESTPGGDIKKGGVEYFEVYKPNYTPVRNDDF